MIEIQKKADCCGCGACAQVCPRSCITLTEDAEGFLYPVVSASDCIHCGACTLVCPMTAQAPASVQAPEGYAAYAREDAVRSASSSGGIFTLLAREILARGGVVFGAAYDEDFSVHHIQIDTPEDLPRLQGSKYVQSRTEEAYRQAKHQLEAGKTVLFSGVGCQIAGLKAYLKKDYPQLYTVDVLCHGVPSPKVWRDYLREQQDAFGSGVEAVSFRDKSTGWTGYSMRLQFRDRQVYQSHHTEDTYLKFFLENISLRPACHSCRFKALPHSADLTLGDAWGIGSYMPDMTDDRGTSLVLVNSRKGQALFRAIETYMVFRPGEPDRLLPPWADSRTPVPPHPRRSLFFSAVARDASMEKLLQVLRGNPVHKALSFGRRLVKKLLRRD